jgi:hypothetical protein
MSPPSPVHVTFGASAGGSLMMAMRAMGRDDEVIALGDGGS